MEHPVVAVVNRAIARLSEELADLRGTHVVGVGIDLVELEEFAECVANRPTIVARVFTPREIAYCRQSPRRIERLAARFAAKEAALKAIGTGWGKGVTWQDAEIVSRAGRAPQLLMSGELRRRALRRRTSYVKVSLTHSGGYAAAMVVLLGD